MVPSHFDRLCTLYVERSIYSSTLNVKMHIRVQLYIAKTWRDIMINPDLLPDAQIFWVLWWWFLALARFIYKWMIFVTTLPHVATFNKFLLLTLVHTTLLTLVSREEGALMYVGRIFQDLSHFLLVKCVCVLSVLYCWDYLLAPSGALIAIPTY